MAETRTAIDAELSERFGMATARQIKAFSTMPRTEGARALIGQLEEAADRFEAAVRHLQEQASGLR